MSAALQDRSDITQLLYRYADAMDRRDVDAVLGCFTDDAETSWHGGVVRADGADQLRRFLENAFSDDVLGSTEKPSSHLMANVMIDLDGNRATVETTALACVTNRPDMVTVRGIHYSDVCERRADGWRIRTRRHRADWEFSAPGQTTGPIAAPGGAT